MLKIALDFDNVLADTTGAWIRYYNKAHNKSIKKSDLVEYYFWNILNISKEEAFRIYSIVWSDWKDLQLLEENSIPVVNDLSKIAEVHLVTSALTDVRNWVMEKGLRVDEIVYTQEKNTLKYDVFIDDSPYIALNIVKNKKICLLYDQPWNKSIQSTDLIRIKKLLEAKEIIKQLQNRSRHRK